MLSEILNCSFTGVGRPAYFDLMLAVPVLSMKLPVS